MNEKTLGCIGTFGCFFLSVIASLIAWFGGLKKSESKTREIVKEMFNLQLTLIILCLITAFIIPQSIGTPIIHVLNLANLYFSIVSGLAVLKDKEFKAPAFRFIK